MMMMFKSVENPVSILYKSTAGRYRPVSYPDGPITARCRFIKNASWEKTEEPPPAGLERTVVQLLGQSYKLYQSFKLLAYMTNVILGRLCPSVLDCNFKSRTSLRYLLLVPPSDSPHEYIHCSLDVL